MREASWEELTAERFRERLNEPFVIRRGDAATVEAELIEVNGLAGHSRREDRSPFSLLFRGPRDAPLEQRIYRLENERLGSCELFLVTVGPDPESGAMLYEAVFT